MEYRFVSGRFLEPGPATVWMRMRDALVAGEQPTPLQRVLVAADSGNGVSATLDWSRYLFINVDLSVHLHRLPAASGSASTRSRSPSRTGSVSPTPPFTTSAARSAGPCRRSWCGRANRVGFDP